MLQEIWVDDLVKEGSGFHAVIDYDTMMIDVLDDIDYEFLKKKMKGELLSDSARLTGIGMEEKVRTLQFKIDCFHNSLIFKDECNPDLFVCLYFKSGRCYINGVEIPLIRRRGGIYVSYVFSRCGCLEFGLCSGSKAKGYALQLWGGGVTLISFDLVSGRRYLEVHTDSFLMDQDRVEVSYWTGMELGREVGYEYFICDSDSLDDRTMYNYFCLWNAIKSESLEECESVVTEVTEDVVGYDINNSQDNKEYEPNNLKGDMCGRECSSNKVVDGVRNDLFQRTSLRVAYYNFGIRKGMFEGDLCGERFEKICLKREDQWRLHDVRVSNTTTKDIHVLVDYLTMGIFIIDWEECCNYIGLNGVDSNVVDMFNPVFRNDWVKIILKGNVLYFLVRGIGVAILEIKKKKLYCNGVYMFDVLDNKVWVVRYLYLRGEVLEAYISLNDVIYFFLRFERDSVFCEKFYYKADLEVLSDDQMVSSLRSAKHVGYRKGFRNNTSSYEEDLNLLHDLYSAYFLRETGTVSNIYSLFQLVNVGCGNLTYRGIMSLRDFKIITKLRGRRMNDSLLSKLDFNLVDKDNRHFESNMLRVDYCDDRLNFEVCGIGSVTLEVRDGICCFNGRQVWASGALGCDVTYMYLKYVYARGDDSLECYVGVRIGGKRCYFYLSFRDIGCFVGLMDSLKIYIDNAYRYFLSKTQLCLVFYDVGDYEDA